jgi:hypothetical protein
VLQSSPETHTYELYKSSGTGSDDDLEFAFAGVINHNLIVQEAADVTAGVDSALATLKSSMAAISEFKEANKYASPVFPWLPSDLCCRVERLTQPVPFLHCVHYV